MREEFIVGRIKVDVVSVCADRSVHPGNPEIWSYGEMPIPLGGCACGRGLGSCGVLETGSCRYDSGVGARQRVSEYIVRLLRRAQIVGREHVWAMFARSRWR